MLQRLGASLVKFKNSIAGAIERTLHSKLSDTVCVLDFGADSTGATASDAAFNAACNTSKLVYVPDGTYLLSTPMVLPQDAIFYGSGTLKFVDAEWWRRGGSSGALDVQERYTLFYKFNSRDDVTLTFDGVPQQFTWVDDQTILAPGSASTVNVIIHIRNGYIKISDAGEMLRSYNTLLGSGSGSALNPALPNPVTAPKGYDNTAVGSRAMMSMVDGVNNTAIGSKALLTNKNGNNNTAMGFLSLYRSTGTGNTAIGSVAGEWLTTGSYNSFLGLSAGEKVLGGSYNVGIGFEAMSEAPETKYTVAVGYRANANPGNHSQSNSVYVGAFAGDFAIGSNNTMVGYRAGNCLDAATAAGTGTGHDNVGVGMFAMRKNLAGSEAVVVGAGAATDAINVEKSVVLGYGACGTTANLGSFTVAVGWKALEAATGDNNVAIGQQAAKATTTGTGNVAIGSGSLVTNTTGVNNVAIGTNSGRLKQDGSNTTDLTNTTTIGNDARVSDSNQVQLGNSATTTYVYGTVQNRSDSRDKTDIRDTILGLDFILGLRPVDGRWDLREDYENGVRDGSKKRERFHHWFIAQEVKELCDKLGVEFGGYQDHKVNGGCDVLSLGYDEFIPPIVKAIQDLSKKIDKLEDKYATNQIS